MTDENMFDIFKILGFENVAQCTFAIFLTSYECEDGFHKKFNEKESGLYEKNKWQNSAFIVQNSWPEQLIKKSLISGVPSVREGETFFAVH